VGKVLGAHDRMSESLERAFGEAPGYPLEQPDRPGVVYGRREAVGDGHFGAALMSRRDALGEAAQVLANDPAPFGRKRTYRAGQTGLVGNDVVGAPGVQLGYRHDRGLGGRVSTRDHSMDCGNELRFEER